MRWTERRTSGVEQVKRGSCVGRLRWLLAVAILVPVAAAQQPQCGSGVIRLPAGVNGTIEICQALAAQVPGLQRQLTEIARSVGDQKEQIRELTRLIKSLNSVSQNIGSQRQAELLKNLSAQLGAAQAAGKQQEQSQISDLADRLDSVKDLLLEKLGNRGTADRANAAVDGAVGDAIARLDLNKAQDLLEDIRIQLNKIGGEVGEVHKQTTDIQKKLEQQQAEELLRRREAEEQQRLAIEKAKKDDLERENDPYSFAQVVYLMASKMTSLGPAWRVTAAISSQPPARTLVDQSVGRPFIDPKLQIAFRTGVRKAWAVDVTDRQSMMGMESYTLKVDELGEQATLCFTAQNSKNGMRRQWTQRYTVQQINDSPEIARANFLPVGTPTLAPADGAPCDGVKEVRESSQAPIALDPRRFGSIRVSAKRKDASDNGKWLLDVQTVPFGSTPYYDVQVQAVMKRGGNKLSPVPLSNREIFGRLEDRYAWLDGLPNEAVVCYTARDPARPQPLRLTQWFTIETSRVTWRTGETGETAAFVPSREPTLTPASNAPCQ